MRRCNVSGMTLLPLMFILSLLGLLAVWSWHGLHQASRTGMQSHSSTLARMRANSAALQALSTAAQQVGVSCRKQKEKAAEVEISRSTCLARPFIPTPRLSTLLNKPSPCTQQSPQTTLHSPLGMSLTPSSLVSKDTCRRLGSQQPHKRNIAVLGNLSLADGFILSSALGGTPPPYSVLSASGFLEVGNKLEVNGASLIYSGGDLSINELSSSSSADVPVVLISSSGSVLVRKASAGILLEAYSKQGLYLPAGKTNQQGILDISPIASFFIGIH